MRSHIDMRPASPPPAVNKRVNGIRPAVTSRGRQVAKQSPQVESALMRTIGRPYS